MFGAIVKDHDSGKYGFLTTDHSASSYSLPVFLPLTDTYDVSGEDARGSGEVGRLIACGFVGELKGKHIGWSTDFSDAVVAAGFTFLEQSEYGLEK